MGNYEVYNRKMQRNDLLKQKDRFAAVSPKNSQV